ncbi:MAG: hypothetical protein KDB01_22650, partial [Planctomycetaceae bacterium]|nr:hypothetical protein [Planctomycetaceae bacterium]
MLKNFRNIPDLMAGVVHSPPISELVFHYAGQPALAIATMKRIDLTHESPTRHGQFSPDGSWVLTAEEVQFGSRGGASVATARVWSADTGTPQTPVIEHVADCIEAVAFAPDSNRFLTATANGLLQIVSVAGGEVVGQWKARSGFVDAAWLPDGSAVVVAHKNKSLSIVDAESLQARATFKLPRAVEKLDVSPDGKSVAAYGEGPHIALRRALNVNRGIDDDTSWPEVFTDNFDRTELGELWTATKGTWSIENAVAVGQLEAIPSATGETTATLDLALDWLPSSVAVEFDAWAEEPMVFGAMLRSHEGAAGVESLFLGANTSQFNQFRRGLAVVSRMSGGVSQIARLDDQAWFEPGQRYRVKTVRTAEQWELWINGRLRLETRIPASLWAPTLQLRGAFGKPDAKVYIDNVAIRVHPQTRDEIDAAKLESKWRSELQLNALVVNALSQQSDLPENVRQLAIRFAGLRQEDPVARQAIIQQLILKGELSKEGFASLIPQFESDSSLNTEDWQKHQTLAALHYRSGNYRAALSELRNAEELVLQATGKSAPVNFALLSLTWAALGDQDKSQRALLRFREQMRSRHWQSDATVSAWARLVQTSASEFIASLDRDPTESLRQLAFTAFENALVDHQPQKWFDLFAPEATIARGRGADPASDDIQLTRSQWIECEKLKASVTPPLLKHLTCNQSEFSVNEDTATETSTYTLTVDDQYWRWDVKAEWRQDAKGRWRIVKRREGLVAYYESPTRRKSLRDDWSGLDARATEASVSGNAAEVLEALIAARLWPKAFELA